MKVKEFGRETAVLIRIWQWHLSEEQGEQSNTILWKSKFYPEVKRGWLNRYRFLGNSQALFMNHKPCKASPEPHLSIKDKYWHIGLMNTIYVQYKTMLLKKTHGRGRLNEKTVKILSTRMIQKIDALESEQA